MTDAQLLEQFVSTGSHPAFGEIVSRHIGWIQAAARRRLHDPGLAEDATQAVFILLAQKAASLRRETVLSAWLFSTLRFTCLAIARSERRRKIREDEAAAMREAEQTTDQVWSELSGQLDEVVAKLSGSDRRAVLLRFYESKTYGEVASVLGISEEAARKRVERAVDKLQGMFQRRGVSFSSGAIGAAMLTHVAPGGAGVATTSVASAALSAASGSSAAVAKTAGGMIAFAQAKAAAIVVAASVAIVAAGGTAVVVATAKSVKPQAAVFAAPVVATVATTTAAVIADSKPRFAAGRILSPEEKPVAGARVTLIDYEPVRGFISAANGTSDANGRFRIDVPAKSNAGGVVIDAPPYAYAQVGVSEDADAVYLTPARTAVVTLLLPDGSPAAGVEVAPRQCNGENAILQSFWAVEFPVEMRAALAQRTDAQGQCRFERMPGKTNVMLEMRDERFAKLDYLEGVPMGEDDVAHGKPVKLTPAASMTGRLIGLDGKGLANVAIFTQAEGGNFSGTARTDADGVYRIGQLGPATYTVIANGYTAATAQMPEWAAAARMNITLARGAAMQNVDIRAVRGAVVRGKVTLQDTGAPVAEAWLDLSGPSSPPEVGRVQDTKTAADGTYAFRVPAGKQRVGPNGGVPDGYTAARMREVNVVDGGKDVTLNFALPRDRAKVASGVVRRADGTPAAGAWVSARAKEDAYSDSFKADAQGRFVVKHIETKMQLRATLGNLQTALPVDVNGGEKDVAMVVEKVTPIVIKGRVVDGAGKGIAGAQVSLGARYGQYSFMPVTAVTADGAGNYAFTDVMPGEKYSVTADAARFGQVTKEVGLKGGETLVEQPALTLQAANGLLTGRVVNDAGEPMANVEINISGTTTMYQQMKTGEDGGFEFADVVEGDTLHVMVKDKDRYLEGGDFKAGTVGAEVVVKKP